MNQPLSLALRAETASAHDDAEGSAFVEQDMGGLACRPAFVALVAQQLVIYRALEEVLWGHYAEHPFVAPVLDEATRRRVLDAAVDSFELNRRVFADLGAARAPEHAAAGGPA